MYKFRYSIDIMQLIDFHLRILLLMNLSTKQTHSQQAKNAKCHSDNMLSPYFSCAFVE